MGAYGAHDGVAQGHEGPVGLSAHIKLAGMPHPPLIVDSEMGNFLRFRR